MFKEAGRRDHLLPRGRFLQELLGRLCLSLAPQGCAFSLRVQDRVTDMATQQTKSLKEKSKNALFLTLVEPPRHTNCLEPSPGPTPASYITPVWILDLERDPGQ